MAREWLPRFSAERLRADLRSLVEIESPSDEPARVSALARWVCERLGERGVAAERRTCAPAGDAVLARVGDGEGGTLLLGHLDTVWPAGTLEALPWRDDGNRATGPGVFDMKAGIAVALSVLEGLAARPGASGPVSLLLVPDEETGSSRSRDLTVEIARRNRQVLVLEPSLDGAAKVARKACGVFRAVFTGRAAHAGLEPEKGASALAELARFVVFLEDVAREDAGTTLVAGRARGGVAANVIPESAEVEVDARAWTKGEVERVEAMVRRYVPRDSRVRVVLEGGFDRPPLDPTPQSEAIYTRARGLAAELGFDLGAARVGGGSDGNFTAAAGVPTLDGLGPRGGGAHSRDEHVIVPDLVPRAALVAALCGPD